MDGVKQGDLASAVLFCIALMMVILIITFKDFESGVSVGGEMLSVISKLAVNSKYFGQSINIPKTWHAHPPDSVMKKMSHRSKFQNLIITFEDFESGVSVSGEILSDKGCAYDIAIMVNNVVRMNSVLSKLAVNSKYFGQSIIIPKTWHA